MPGIIQLLRKETWKNPGDTVHVAPEEDTEERIVESRKEETRRNRLDKAINKNPAGIKNVKVI